MSLKSVLQRVLDGLKQAKDEQFSGHPIANLIRKDLLVAVQTKLVEIELTTPYSLKASAGAGNWADVPWLSILDPRVTKSTQSGYYPVYLFAADGSGVYLSLEFGTTELNHKFGAAEARAEAQKLRDEMRAAIPKLKYWNDEIRLQATTPLGKSYEWASAGAKFYAREALDEAVLAADLQELMSIYAQLASTISETDALFAVTKQLSKPFILLAGISGTGKTRFVRKQAETTGSLAETYRLTSVRPDWHEPSDLLGYVSRLSGQEKYVTTDVLRFIAKAWRALVNAGLDVGADAVGLRVTGRRDELAAIAPYWLCLDEMNLAPVEQYFADYLSALETREWSWEEDEFTYRCDSLLKGAEIDTLAKPAQDALRAELGLDDTAYDRLWDLLIKQGLSLPFNLIVAGTVNMDETTHGFSRKVIDRALTFDFGEFFPNNPAEFFTPTTAHKTLSYPIYSHATLDELVGVDTDGKLSIDFFEAVNAVLKNTPFELAFRALNELLLAVISEQPKDAGHLHAVWDDFLMCKVLPRIEGDVDKLGSGNDSLLAKLNEALGQQLVSCWADGAMRPDLFREQKDGSLLQVSCRSKAKLQWMQKRLDTAGFTSFWP